MNLSFRPKTPPFELTYLKYASMPRATFPAIAASPLSGTLEPILISLAGDAGRGERARACSGHDDRCGQQGKEQSLHHALRLTVQATC
jgi:hypothetical protein